MTMKYNLYQIDSFTKEKFSGNAIIAFKSELSLEWLS